MDVQKVSFFIAFSSFNRAEYSITCSISLTRFFTSANARVILRSGVTLETLTPVRQSLEDTFFEMTGE